MHLATFSLLVSIVYAALAILAPDVAEALTIAFVALLVAPSLYHDFGRRR